VSGTTAFSATVARISREARKASACNPGGLALVALPHDDIGLASQNGIFRGQAARLSREAIDHRRS